MYTFSLIEYIFILNCFNSLNIFYNLFITTILIKINYSFYIILLTVITLFLNKKQTENWRYNNYKV